MMKAFKDGYENRQWSVVRRGLYCREHDYLAEAHHLADIRNEYVITL
jgi:hypothetical protein